MPRERAKLTDKQERILVQCQLMGLTPRDMQQISNRLIALEREASFKKTIADACAGMSWVEVDKGWTITDKDGKIYQCIKVPNTKKTRRWYENKYVWSVEVSKPGTRFKNRTVKDLVTYVDHQITAKLCPANSKDLLGLLITIQNGKV